MPKLELRSIIIAFLFSLIGITIISLMISQFTDIATLQTGKAFLIFFVGVFISVIFWAGFDKKIDKSEVWTLLIIAFILAGAYYAMYQFIPEIFSVLPSSTKQLFSSIIN